MQRTRSDQRRGHQAGAGPWPLVLAALLVCASAQHAAAVTIDATDRGWYGDDGTHNTSILNYLAGDCDGGTCVAGSNTGIDEFRNFFVFDLSGVTGPITAATLILHNTDGTTQFPNNVGFFSDTGSETYLVSEVSTAIASLLAGTGGMAAFGDLGSGTSYASFTATSAANGTFVEIALNSAAIAALNQASGLFAFGGSITTLNGFPDEETLFAFSDSGLLSDTQLELTVVPEPSTALLLAAAIALLGALRTRRTPIPLIHRDR
ncbi:MAG: PEP-CTERM sorting domain-containing protein [Deltaproteobacteria bacterium]|nr:MAG: PEP-CTERM sorting domain-containing protein [Deltaproteobacteria bacterium]